MARSSSFAYADLPVYKYQTFDIKSVQFTNIPLAARKKAEKEAKEAAEAAEAEGGADIPGSDEQEVDNRELSSDFFPR